MADNLGLLVDLLRHEMAMVALVDQQRPGGRLDHRADDGVAERIVHLYAVALHDGPVAVLEIADCVSERCERDGVGAEIHLPLAVANCERRSVARADQQILLPLEQECERKGAAQAR